MEFHPPEDASATCAIVAPIIIERYGPKSVLDLGCNVGWWLHYLIKGGVEDVVGIDGDNMIPLLKFPVEKFQSHDLRFPLDLNRKFDLVICVEVAEHLEPEYADELIQTIVRHSDRVFFSAATPYSGGWHHVNEQPHSYWVELFKKHGFEGHSLESSLPDVPHIYYKRNAWLFSRG